MKEKICKTCFRIACKNCTWIASDTEVAAIQAGKLTVCPVCGWSPGASLDTTV